MTRQEYVDECESIARDARTEVRENDADPHDYIWETVDGHEWIIYTRHHLSVLEHSENYECGIDEGLVDANAAIKEGGLDRLTMQLAFCAMECDVEAAYSHLPEEDEEEDEA